ncbi:hypothetical protein [Stenotrophomonas sp. PS02301]|uniref:hypothetical protein n=1 Tax=Stenotrophomonas sp. PS02301 TaxID=2991427 RepID=UPI00249A8A3F|nr:hypothetical protein [Stenotrophomonas sp. PS02301]
MQRLNDNDLAKYIDSSTPDDLLAYFAEHNVNDRITVEVGDRFGVEEGADATFYGTALSYAIWSNKTGVEHIRTLIHEGADVSFEDNLQTTQTRSAVQFVDEEGDERGRIEINLLRDTEGEKGALINRTHQHWRQRDRTDAEVVTMLRQERLDVIADYFESRDPNSQITVEFPRDDIRYIGPVAGFAAFDSHVPNEAFKALMERGGEINAVCRIEKISDTRQYDQDAVLHQCSSPAKVQTALDAGGMPDVRLINDVLSLPHFNAPGRWELEQRLVNVASEQFQDRHLHELSNPKVLVDLLMMGHDASVLNADGQSLMVNAVVSGDFLRADALREFGLPMNGGAGQHPMDHVVNKFNEDLAYSNGSVLHLESRCNRCVDYVVENSEDPTADLVGYMKMAYGVRESKLQSLFDKGADSSQVDLADIKDERLQGIFNNQQSNILNRHIGSQDALISRQQRRM